MKTRPAAWRAGPILGMVLFSLAIWVMHRELSAHHVKDILHHVGLIPAGPDNRGALSLTAAGYALMTFYDLLALRYLKQSLAYAKIAMAAFIGGRLQQQHRFFHDRRCVGTLPVIRILGPVRTEDHQSGLFLRPHPVAGLFLRWVGCCLWIDPLTLPSTVHLPFVSTCAVRAY